MTVVLGNQSDAIASLLADLPCRTVVNPKFADGQSTSFLAGLNALPEEADAVIVLLGDQPTISAHTINLVIEIMVQNRRADSPGILSRYPIAPAAL